MIKLEENVKFYSNYFSGFEKILAHKSASETALGAAQVFSYGTILVPLIFAVGYEMANVQLADAKKLQRKISNYLWLRDSSKPSQKEYIDFLTMQVEDKKYESISEIFPELTPSSQKAFSYFLAKKRKISVLLDHIPDEAREIHLRLADPLSTGSPKKAAFFVNNFFKKLQRLEELNRLTLDIQDIAPYAEGFRQKMPEFLASLRDAPPPNRRMRRGFSLQITRHKTSPEEIKNSLNLASHIVLKALKYLRHTETLSQVTIRFSDHELTVRKEAPSTDLRINTDFESIYSLPLV